ncbi:hypothetical protein [Aliivibrio salmonicida]|uniref:hypothetical protein n=1 Tax=Aliivibrio salmonicida TaxID=40269 RepID=UPI003D0A1516
MKNKTLITSSILTVFLSSSALSLSLPSDGSSGIPNLPPDYGIKKLEIFAGSGLSDTYIYANGNMQAQLDVLYELEEAGDSVEKISLKKSKTGGSLSALGWNVTDIKNPYFSHDTRLKIDPRSSDTHSPSYSYLTKYVSTNLKDNISVCVELTTVNGYFKSTCYEDSLANRAVEIHAKQDQVFTVADWNLSVHTKITNSLGDESWIRGYTPPNGRTIAYVDYKGAYAKYGRTAKNSKVIFASPSYSENLRKGQSILNVFMPKTGLTSQIFYYGKILDNSHVQYKPYTVYGTANTTNSLIFVSNYVWGETGISLNPLGGSTHLVRSIDVYDTYGNKTTFYFSRDGLGINII